MNIKKLSEAIGNIEDDLIYEYQMYRPKKRIQPYRAVELLAACAVLALIITLAAKQDSGVPAPPAQSQIAMTTRSPHPSEPYQTAETAIPSESQTPAAASDEAQTEQPLQVAENDPVYTPFVSDPIADQPTATEPFTAAPSENNKAPGQSTTTIVGQPSPVHPDLVVWNQITACTDPYEQLTSKLDPIPTHNDQFETEDSESDNSPDSIGGNGPSQELSEYRVENLSPHGWYWLDDPYFNPIFAHNWLMPFQDTESCLLSRLYTEAERTIHMVQIKSDAASLEEANETHHEQMFENTLAISYLNGEPLYLIENANGETYARIYKNNILITVWEKGFGKDILLHLLQNLQLYE